MLYLEATKNLSGISIWGTTTDLQFLRGFMGDLLENESFFKNQKLVDELYDIPYEVRKAYEGHRHIEKYKDFQDNEYSLYGSEYLLPSFIIFIALMRESMAFNKNNKFELSVMYALEFQLEKILEKNFQKDAKEILEILKVVSSLNQDLLFDKLPSRCNFFISLRTIKEKQKLLLPILKSFLPYYKNSKLEFLSNEYPRNFEW